jgi:hypothetical protein
LCASGAVVSLLVAGWLGACGPGKTPPPHSLYGNWTQDSFPGGSANNLALSEDGGYEHVTLVVRGISSETSWAQAEVETGSFAAHGSTITFTPTASSCPGAAGAAYSINYVISAFALTIDQEDYLPTLEPPAAGYPLTTGCFESTLMPPDCSPAGWFNACPFEAAALQAIGSCSSEAGTCSPSAVCCLGIEGVCAPCSADGGVDGG